MKLRLVVVTGPTACGKTQFAVSLAHHFGSEIISADSRQVYRGLDIGTGKDLDEYRAVEPPVPYHLIDIADPRSVYTLFHYQRDCYRVLREKARDPRFADGARPLLLVGGTGLYIEAVLRDYSIANVPEDAAFREAALQRPHEELVAELAELDPARHGETDLTSTRRVVRALEIAHYAKGTPVESSEERGVELDAEIVCVTLPREEINARIESRLDARLDEGMLDEARSLLEGGLPPERFASLGLEYRELAEHLLGHKSFEEMRADLAQEIRRFAKRQRTWFRGMERRGFALRRVPPTREALDALVEELARS